MFSTLNNSRRIVVRLPPLAVVLLTTVMFAGVAHAASRGVPPAARALGSGVPTYNIAAACRDAESIPEARIFEYGGPDAIKSCVEDENQARAQVLQQWSQFKAPERTMCIGATDSGSLDPIYTELLTCLEMTRENHGSATSTAPAH
jgi:hypothetical protein